MIRLLLFLSIILTGSLPAAERPNIVILLADDAGWGDYGHSGNPQVATPAVDSLAKDGLSLDRFFVCPVCSPTRAEMLTGRYHPRTGVRGVSTGQERLNLDEKTLADSFKAAGYATGAFGKWHNGSQWPYHPMARGFDEFFGYTSGHWGEYFDAPLEDNGIMIRSKGYIVDVCTDKALDFIERNRARPFLCYVPFTTPHTPWAAPEQDWTRWKDRELTGTATDPRREDSAETRCAMAMVENQDFNVGRILSKLESLDLSQNTLVIYFSDNGPNSHRWNGGMKGIKASTDEGGLRSVCYWRWPARLPAGHTVSEITGAIDFLPTLTSLAKIPRIGDKSLDGRDLTPLLTRSAAAWPDRLLFSTWNHQLSVRSATHRLDAAGKLYNITTDPGQTTPLNTREPDSAARLAAAARAWRQELLDSRPPLPGGAVDPRPLTIGFPEFPVTMLPARDGTPHGNVSRSSKAPNSSYFTNWKSPDDSITWEIENRTAGRYQVTLDYTCPLPDAGSEIELSFHGARLAARVTPGWDPPLHTNQDTLPRTHGESPLKDFKTLDLGEITLPAAAGPLTLRALQIPGNSVLDLRRLTLSLLSAEPLKQ